MLRYILFLLICSLLSGCICPKITVCFTPGGNCANQIIHEINQSKKSVLIQAYEFTSKPIAKSLIMAKQRGIDVKVILDESQIQSKYSVINELFQQKIPIWIDYKPAIAHSKLMIIDNRKIITGSFNFTYSAQGRNAENLLIITGNHPLVEQYVENWQKRQLQSNPYQPIEE
ncbi:phospholipase D family nuclease [Wolbachia endosymbiont of Folsomia candida]|uniref:phospholipase D family nuclease n=1 Tax=Wolbachia endosymbiont of Folsomia candida TaxID=169402 RepID=UPI000B11B65D|nr:phospholipase D family protein [Wolbachia endosymbiont of Folsomia candida]APR97833.1 phospholipase D family protein [Wolbachia endosymbiont of Folsomia candida]